MLNFIRQKDFLYPFVIWLIVLMWYLAIGDRLFQVPGNKLESLVSAQSFWLLNSPPEEAKDITIVAIDQASRRNLGLKWPWKRSVTAELIRNIASLSPRAIGIDIVFSGDSDEQDDRELVSALGSHPRIVLGYLSNKASKEKPKQAFIDAVSSIGFVNKPLEGGVVKSVIPYYVNS